MGALTEVFVLPGRRIVLRETAPEDALLYLSWLQNGVFRRYRPGLEFLLKDAEIVREFLAWRRGLVPAPEIEVWVYRKGEFCPRGLMGLLGLDYWHRKGEAVAIFSGLAPRERLEALWLLLEGGFSHLRLEKIFFQVRETERRFLHFLEKVGLRPEAYLAKEGRDPETGLRYGVYRFAIFPETLERLKNLIPIPLPLSRLSSKGETPF